MFLPAMNRVLGTAMLMLLSTTAAWSGSYRVLHNFQEHSLTPGSGLVVDGAGNGYGTTLFGGINDAGAVYQISPSSGFHVIYGFSGPDGAQPQGNLAIDAAGNLYGTTTNGGSCCGTVFRLSPPTNGGPWTETVLYNFAGGDDGAIPEAGVILDSSGNLYGTAATGGRDFCGVVFSLTPSGSDQWTENVLHEFTGDGCFPTSSLIFDSSGNLYGTTRLNGVWGGGTVFQLSPGAGGSWTHNVIHEFNPNLRDGVQSTAALVFDAAGNLYGTTESGGAFNYGIVFELSPNSGDWTESILHHFGSGTDGADPRASLIFDRAGNLLGTTYGGGVGGTNSGTVFELTHGLDGRWTETVLVSFGRFKQGKRGAQPSAPLLLDSAGRIYGTTVGGGTDNRGVIFRITP